MIILAITNRGTKGWRLNWRYHRANGPARVWTDGHTEWFKNGQLHRTDGPAIIDLNGCGEYWMYGKQLSEYEMMFISAPND